MTSTQSPIKIVYPVQIEDLTLLPMSLKWRISNYSASERHNHTLVLGKCSSRMHSSGSRNRQSFVQQQFHVFGLRKCLLSITFCCFLCRRYNAENIQPIMARLPAFRFQSAATQFPFYNSGVEFFGPFYIEETKRKNIMVSLYVLDHVSSSPWKLPRSQHRCIPKCISTFHR